MALMAQKLEATLALEGQFSTDGLAAMSADSGSLTMELARSLVENLDFGDADRVWGHSRVEHAETEEGLTKVEDFSSEGKDDPEPVEFVQGMRYEQRLLFVP